MKKLIPKHQNGKPLTRQETQVAYSSPRYKELYKLGKISKYRPQEDIYDMQEMDTFTVEGKDERVIDAMEKGRMNFITGALDASAAPQRFAVQALTGKYQDPSKAWGFQKPGNWFDSASSFGKNLANLGLDSVADPLNIGLTGVGKNLLRTNIRRSVQDIAQPHIRSIANNTKAFREGVADVEKLKRIQGGTSEFIKLSDPSTDAYLKDVRDIGRIANDMRSQINIKPISKTSKLHDDLLNKAINLEQKGIIPKNSFYDMKYIADDIKVAKEGMDPDKVISFIDEGLDELGLDRLNDKAREFIREYPIMEEFAKSPEMLEDMNMFSDFARAINTDPQAVLDDLAGTRNKNSHFSPDDTYVGRDLENIFPKKSKLYSPDGKNIYSQPKPKLISTPGYDPSFQSLPIYDKVKTKLLNKYTDFRIGKDKSVIGEIPDTMSSKELLPSLFATYDNTGARLRKAYSYVDGEKDGAFIGAGSLSSDSYSLSLDFMNRAAKQPGNQIRFTNYGNSNGMGFVDQHVTDKNLLASELTRKIETLENSLGRKLPKPIIDENGAINLPKFVLTKGETNNTIDAAMANKKPSELFNRNNPVAYTKKPTTLIPKKKPINGIGEIDQASVHFSDDGRRIYEAPDGNYYDVSDEANPRLIDIQAETEAFNRRYPENGVDLDIDGTAGSGISEADVITDAMNINTSMESVMDRYARYASSTDNARQSSISPMDFTNLAIRPNAGSIPPAQVIRGGDGLFYNVASGDPVRLDGRELQNYMADLARQRRANRRPQGLRNSIPPPPTEINQVYKKGGLIKRNK